MVGFSFLIGHLLGDFILQNDWMAKNKAILYPKDKPKAFSIHLESWKEEYRRYLIGFVACLIHCLLYTFAVFICTFWFLPLWSYSIVFFSHWVIDRYRLAFKWMVNVSGQKEFALGALSPWSVIVVDNTFHLIVLFLIGVCYAS